MKFVGDWTDVRHSPARGPIMLARSR
jgi:hypothetical protein